MTREVKQNKTKQWRLEEVVKTECFHAGFDEKQIAVEKYDSQGVWGKCSKLEKT